MRTWLRDSALWGVIVASVASALVYPMDWAEKVRRGCCQHCMRCCACSWRRNFPVQTYLYVEQNSEVGAQEYRLMPSVLHNCAAVASGCVLARALGCSLVQAQWIHRDSAPDSPPLRMLRLMGVISGAYRENV